MFLHAILNVAIYYLFLKYIICKIKENLQFSFWDSFLEYFSTLNEGEENTTPTWWIWRSIQKLQFLMHIDAWKWTLTYCHAEMNFTEKQFSRTNVLKTLKVFIIHESRVFRNLK